jgi:hypothetical protein
VEPSAVACEKDTIDRRRGSPVGCSGQRTGHAINVTQFTLSLQRIYARSVRVSINPRGAPQPGVSTVDQAMPPFTPMTWPFT